MREGGGRDICRVRAGTRDRGARAGDHAKAAGLRGTLEAALGGNIRSVVPGSPEAAQLKDALIAEGLWSQYLEVAIARMRKSSPSRRSCRRWAGGCGRRPLRLDLEQPGAEVVLMPNAWQGGRRDARQRRQPARFRGALGAAARQGEGQ